MYVFGFLTNPHPLTHSLTVGVFLVWRSKTNDSACSDPLIWPKGHVTAICEQIETTVERQKAIDHHWENLVDVSRLFPDLPSWSYLFVESLSNLLRPSFLQICCTLRNSFVAIGALRANGRRPASKHTLPTSYLVWRGISGPSRQCPSHVLETTTLIDDYAWKQSTPKRLIRLYVREGRRPG